MCRCGNSACCWRTATFKQREVIEQMQRSSVSILSDAKQGRDYMEHRWGHRREISRAVHLGTRSGLAARGRITNVSISGAFLVSPLPVSLYSYIEVQFIAMLHGKRSRMAVEGQVVRKEGGGFGIEWCEFAPEAVRALVAVPPFRLAEPPQPRAEWEPAARPHPRIVHS